MYYKFFCASAQNGYSWGKNPRVLANQLSRWPERKLSAAVAVPTWGLDGAVGLAGQRTTAHRQGRVPRQFESAVG